VFYVLYFNLFTFSLNILFSMLYEVFIYTICVEHVRVGHVSETMRHPFGNDTFHMNL
jgi:hypothetical protein